MSNENPKEEPCLFDTQADWQAEWNGMPEFVQDDLTPFRVLNLRFRNEKEGTLPKSKMLERLHPDVAEVVWRFNRWHHHVDYTPFKRTKLKRKAGVVIPEGVNNYGMKLVEKN